MKRTTATLAAVFFVTLLTAGSCKPLVEDSSAAAFSSGNATMLLGGCSRPMGMGYEICQLTRGQAFPTLRMGFMNPAEWAVSDCTGGFYKAGSTSGPTVVEVDLSSLKADIEKHGVCWLRMEAVERYPDKNDKEQMHDVRYAGGFLIELLAPGYLPVPSESEVAWCYEVRRTTKGRTTVKQCR